MEIPFEPFRHYVKSRTSIPKFKTGDIVMANSTAVTSQVTNDIRQFGNGRIEYRLANGAIYGESVLTKLCSMSDRYVG